VEWIRVEDRLQEQGEPSEPITTAFIKWVKDRDGLPDMPPLVTARFDFDAGWIACAEFIADKLGLPKEDGDDGSRG